MDGIIGDSYSLSIGHTHIDLGQSANVQKKTDRTFWSRLQEALRASQKPATQAFAARIAGVKQPSVSLWNEPGGFPTLENTVALARQLNVCVEWLLTERGPMRPGPPEEADARELWSLWPRLDDRTKVRIVTIANENVRPDAEDSSMLQRG